MEPTNQPGGISDEEKAQAIIDATENINCSVNFSPSRVVVLGTTGAGKSTFMSYISGAPCVVREENADLKIEADSSEFKISHDCISETTAPQGWFC